MVETYNSSQLTISVQILAHEDQAKCNLTVKLSLVEPTTVRLIHETEVVHGSMQPKFVPFGIKDVFDQSQNLKMVFTVSDSQESGPQEVGTSETNLTKVLIATNSTSILEICSGGEIKGHITLKYDHTMAESIT